MIYLNDIAISACNAWIARIFITVTVFTTVTAFNLNKHLQFNVHHFHVR